MHLYLVQHALSKPKEEDPERGLREQGWADVKKIAVFVTEHTNINVASILHSGKTRAEQTARVFAEHIKPKDSVEQVKNLAPMDDPGVWADLANALDKDTMLVGHLPHLSRLASLLLCGDADRGIVQFHNAGIVCLGKCDAGGWELEWSVIPEVLK